MAPLTPPGNLTLVDDAGSESSGKQFITVVTKNGNYFYLVIDRDKDGADNVHFLNLVDESDLLSLLEEDEARAYRERQELESSIAASLSEAAAESYKTKERPSVLDQLGKAKGDAVGSTEKPPDRKQPVKAEPAL